jgi:N-acetylmuramoyl-L-alanine amidase
MKPKRVILHCSATPDYPDSSKKYDLFGAADIDAWHKKRGWRGIGYHYVIRRTGVIEFGRQVNRQGAHTRGENADSVGICYIGSKRPTLEQIWALLKLHKELYLTYKISWDKWHGHYEFTSKKDCPGIPMDLVREMFRCHAAAIQVVDIPTI